jgi:hypothetical protein
MNFEIYQPADRYWRFQVLEALVFAGLSFVLLGAAVWWIRRRLT